MKCSSNSLTGFQTCNRSIGCFHAHKAPMCDCCGELKKLHICNICVIAFFSQILSHNILVVLAIMFPKEFTPEIHVAMDKFLAALALALAEKYR